MNDDGELNAVIWDSVVRLRQFCRIAAEEYDNDENDADVSRGMWVVYNEPPEGTPDSWVVADVALVCAAYETLLLARRKAP